MGSCSSSGVMGALGTVVNVGVNERRGSRNSSCSCFLQEGEERQREKQS